MVLEVLKALLRRWYVVVFGVLLTAGLVFGANRSSPPVYHARGLVLVLPSKVAVGQGGNPLLVLDGLEQPASILVAHFASAPAKAEVATVSPTAQFTVLLDESVRGPVVAVDVTDSSPTATMAVLRHLMDEFPERLTALQQQVDASSNSYIGSMPLSADESPAQDLSATLRLMIAALLLGVVGTVVGTFGFDSFMQRHATRRDDGRDDEPDDEPDDESAYEAVTPSGRATEEFVDARVEVPDALADGPVGSVDTPAPDTRTRRARDAHRVTESEVSEHVGSSRT